MPNLTFWCFFGVLALAATKQIAEYTTARKMNRTKDSSSIPIQGWARAWGAFEVVFLLLLITNLALTVGPLWGPPAPLNPLAIVWAALLLMQNFPSTLVVADAVNAKGVRYLGTEYLWSVFSSAELVGPGKIQLNYRQSVWGFPSFRIRVASAAAEQVLALASEQIGPTDGA